MSNGLPFDASAWAPTDMGKLPTVWNSDMVAKVHNAAGTFKGAPSVYTFPAVMQMTMAPVVTRRDVGVMTAPGPPEGSASEVGSVQR